MNAGADWINNTLAWWVRHVLRFPKTTVVIVLLLAAGSVDYARTRLGINTDTANMISAELPWRKDFNAYRESFAARDRNVVIVVESAVPDAADSFAMDLAAQLRREPTLFHSVFLAGEGEFFERNGLMYLTTEQIEDLGDRLAEAQPLIGLLGERFNGAGVVSVVRRVLEESDGVAVDSTQLDTLFAELARSLAAAAVGVRRPLAWRELIAGAAEARTRPLLLVQPALDFDLIQPAREAIERIRIVAADLQARQNVEVTVRLTGTIAMEHEELVSVTRGAKVAGIAALALVTLVLLWALRSFVLLVISVITLLAGLCYTAAFAAFAVGHLNLLSVAFAVLYVGLGVDFILHICLRLKELSAQGAEITSALTETVRGVGTSLVICAVTTAAGFYAFIPTAFEGVSELGLISGTGMLISLAISVTLLPALLALFPTLSQTPVVAVRVRRRAAFGWLREPRRVVSAALVIGAFSVVALPQVSFNGNPIHLRDPESESVRAIEDLAADGEAPLFDLVALAPDHATAQDWAGRLAALPEVRRAITVDSLIPPDQSEKQLLLEDIELAMGPGFAELTPAQFEAAALRQELAALSAVLHGREFGGDAERALVAAADDLLANLDRDDRVDQRLRDLDADLTAGLPRQLQRLATGLEGKPFERADLPPELAERWVNDIGQELVEIAPAENVNDNAAAERFVGSVRSVVANATGLPVVHQEASATVVRSFQLAFLYALILVSALLFFFLRSLADVALVLVPIMFAAAVTAAATVWFGIPFNFANIIALPLLVGVGVDNGIHLVHRMRSEPPKDGEPFSTSTSRAVLASGLTTIASFGNLAFSPHVGMASMGKLLTLGMTVTLIATLVLLPALLRLSSRT